MAKTQGTGRAVIRAAGVLALVLAAATAGEGNGFADTRAPHPFEVAGGGPTTIVVPPSGQPAPPLPKGYPGCKLLDTPVTSPSAIGYLSTYIDGMSTVGKLHSSAAFRPSCVEVIQTNQQGVSFPYFLQKSLLWLEYRGKHETTPSASTFLTFGFMPTTAVVTLVQTGPATVDTKLNLLLSSGSGVVRIPLVLHVSDVKVNGTPLNVGADCETTGPLYSDDPDPTQNTHDHLVLQGNSIPVPGGSPGETYGWTLGNGGPLSGTVTIPPFQHCGAHGDDVDSVLTAALSGPDNPVAEFQGYLCGYQVPSNYTNGTCESDGNAVAIQPHSFF